jgi:acetolactate synthase regulatory subunit
MSEGESTGAVWTLRLRDRPGAVERVLSTLRRRLVPLEGMAMERADAGELTLALRVGGLPALRARIQMELGALEDVRALESKTEETHPTMGVNER